MLNITIRKKKDLHKKIKFLRFNKLKIILNEQEKFKIYQTDYP